MTDLHHMSFPLAGGSTLRDALAAVQDKLKGLYSVGPFVTDGANLVAQVSRVKVKQSEVKQALAALHIPVDTAGALWFDFTNGEYIVYYDDDEPVRRETE